MQLKVDPYMPDHIKVILRTMFAFAILFGGARLLGKQTY